MPDFTFEKTFTGQVARAHDQFVLTDYDADSHEVYETQQDRIAAANADHDTVTNAQLGTLDNPYEGGAEITVASNRAGVDADPEDTQGVEDLEAEVLVDDAADADELFTTGGPISPDSYTGVESLSPYVDSTWLVERGKQTAERYW